MSPEQYENKGWNQYQMLVLYRLDEMKESIETLDKRVDALARSQLITKVKLATVGSLAGVTGSVLVFAIRWVLGK